jgi:outer membrane protein TolC
MKKFLIIINSLAILASPITKAQETIHLSLSDCRRMALSSSEDLKKAENNTLKAAIDVKNATTSFLPKVDASLMGEYMFPDMNIGETELMMHGAYLAGITLTQPIYAGGKIMAGRRMSKIGEKISEEQKRMAKMDAIVEADNAYWTYVAVREKVAMLEAFYAQMDTIHRQTNVSVSAGLATDNDLLRIDAKQTEISYLLQKAKNGADLCKMSLCRIVNLDYDTNIIPTDTIITVEAPSNLSTDFSSRPEMKLLEKQIEIGEEQIKMTRGDVLPTVGLSVGYTYYGNIKMKGVTDLGEGMTMPYTKEFKDGLGLAMLAVKIPIFHWGENLRKIRKARYDLDNAKLDLSKNEKLLSIAVQQSIRNLTDGYRMVSTAEKGLRQANENLRVMINRYEVNLSSLTDLMDAQTQWQQARNNLIEAQTQYKIYQTAYLRSVGQLID